MQSPSVRLKRRLWIYSGGALEKARWVAARRSGQAMKLPDFLVIGAQKAGTTWLYWCFKEHPEIFLPEPKELHYFDANFHSPFETYLRYFRDADRRVLGEMTPCYSSLSGTRVAAVRQLLGPKKIVFILRDPVERAKSHALMELVRQQRRRPEEISKEDFIRHFRSRNSVLRTRYLRTYRNWSRAFGEANIHLDSYERIKVCPDRMLRDICAFVGADPDFAFSPEQVAKVVYNNEPFEFPAEFDGLLEDMYGEEREFCRRVTKEKLGQ